MENNERPLNKDFYEGETDGAYKKAHKDRGGIVESATDLVRSQLHPWYGYGFTTQEAHPKVLPGGGTAP